MEVCSNSDFNRQHQARFDCNFYVLESPIWRPRERYFPHNTSSSPPTLQCDRCWYPGWVFTEFLEDNLRHFVYDSIDNTEHDWDNKYDDRRDNHRADDY